MRFQTNSLVTAGFLATFNAGSAAFPLQMEISRHIVKYGLAGGLKSMSFCTVINCMDGRTQLPVIVYVQKRFDVEYVDTISEPGPNGILATRSDEATVDSIKRRIAISMESHDSRGIAVVGHWDCAGNPVEEDDQNKDTRNAVAYLRKLFPNTTIIGLWVDSEWKVTEIEC